MWNKEPKDGDFSSYVDKITKQAYDENNKSPIQEQAHSQDEAIKPSLQAQAQAQAQALEPAPKPELAQEEDEDDEFYEDIKSLIFKTAPIMILGVVLFMVALLDLPFKGSTRILVFLASLICIVVPSWYLIIVLKAKKKS